jgi:uncharacterized protein YycO
MTKVQIVLFKNHERLLQKLIRWQTDSQYSHAALLFDDNWLIESGVEHGVRQREFVYDPAIHDVFNVLPPPFGGEADSILRFAERQAGKKYDFWGCLRFISRRRLPENDKWFCSELVFEAFAQAGYRLLNNVESYQVSPGDLATSPYLFRVK